MNQRRNYPALTGLKGIFMFIIVFHNIFSSYFTPFIDAIPMSSFITKFGGDLGNSMFFILSGFLIANGYRNRIANREISFLSYLGKRLCKLYPLYIITNLVMLALMFFEGCGPSIINLERLAFTVLLQAGGGLPVHPFNGPTWFIGPLFLCYSLYFLIAYFATKPTPYYCSIALVIILGYAGLTSNHSIPFSTAACGIALMNFFIGCALVDIYALIRQKNYKWLPAVCFFMLTGSGFMMMRYGVEIIAGNVPVAFGFVLCPMMLYLALESKLFSVFLQSKLIQYLGKISVSVYFWHLVFYSALCDILAILGIPVMELQLLLYLILLIPFSTFSYHYIENRVTPPPQ